MQSPKPPPLSHLIAIAAIAALPFFSTFSVGKMLVASLFLLPVAFGVRKGAVKIGPSGWLLGLYLVLSIPAYIQSPSMDTTLTSLWLDLASVAVFLLASRHVERILSLSAFATSMAFAFALVFALWAVELVLSAPVGLLGALPGASTMGNPDFVGELACVVWPLFLYMAVQHARRGTKGTRGRRKLLLWGFMTMLALGVLGASSSTTALVATGVMVLVAGGIFLWNRNRWLGVAAVVSVLVAAWLVRQVEPVEEKLAPRSFLYEVQLEGTTHSTLIGAGVGGFPEAYLDAQARRLSQDPSSKPLWTNAIHGHNFILHTAVERGFPCAVALILFWLSVLFCAFRRRWGEQGVHGVLLAGLLFIALGSVGWHVVPFRLWLFLSAGLVAAGDRRGVVQWEKGGWALSVVVALMLFLSSWYALADQFRVARAPTTALKVFPWHRPALFDAGWAAMSKNDAKTACQRFRMAHENQPNLSTAMAMGSCCAAMGRLEDAATWYRRAIHWKSDFAAAHSNLATIYFREHRLNLAARHIKRAVSLRPSDGDIARARKKICADNPDCNAKGPVRD